MRFVGRGHPAVRATHAKTLEFTPDAAITARATCVLAVGVEAEPPAPMAGRVRIRIAAGTERFTLEAEANPLWDPSGPIVVRRGPARLPGTFATDATASSADLPRSLVAALQDPDALVTADVLAAPDDRPTTVLAYLATPVVTPWLQAELDRADTVIVQDAGARALVAPRAGDGPRTLVLATDALPRPPHNGAVVDVIGLGPVLAAAAASPSAGPLLVADPGTDHRQVLRDAPATARVALTVPAASVHDVRAAGRTARGRDGAVLVPEDGRPLRVADGDPAPPIRGAVAVCLDASPAGEAIDPAVRAAVSALLADGVPTRAAARALAALTGWDRRRAYDAVLEWPGR